MASKTAKNSTGWAYTMMATDHDHDGKKVYHDGHNNENVKNI